MKIRIDIPHHPYDIQIEKRLSSSGWSMVENSGNLKKVVIVTDNHVASLYAEKVKLSLEDAGFQVAVFWLFRRRRTKKFNHCSESLWISSQAGADSVAMGL